MAGIAVLLYTPRTGRETRSMIKDRTLQAKEAIIWHANQEAQAVEQKNNNHKKK